MGNISLSVSVCLPLCSSSFFPLSHWEFLFVCKVCAEGLFFLNHILPQDKMIKIVLICKTQFPYSSGDIKPFPFVQKINKEALHYSTFSTSLTGLSRCYQWTGNFGAAHKFCIAEEWSESLNTDCRLGIFILYLDYLQSTGPSCISRRFCWIVQNSFPYTVSDAC